MDDLIIIGAGVAGMTASIYASRYKINHLLIGETPGGQGTLAGTVENYPGYLAIPGPELMQTLIEQVKKYDVEIKQALLLVGLIPRLPVPSMLPNLRQRFTLFIAAMNIEPNRPG